tara:strand:+ start:1096 stop:1452 length:357 start_codon:yes stop_codon:yes gene_type:complete
MIIDGYTEEEDLENEKALQENERCSDCYGIDNGYCRCTVADWDVERYGMTMNRVLRVYREEEEAHDKALFKRQCRRRSKRRWNKAKVVTSVVHFWTKATAIPGSKAVAKAAKRFKALQ